MPNASYVNDNNSVLITGTIVDNLEYSHNTCSENFYRGRVSVRRKSGVEDIIPIVVSEILIDATKDWSGVRVTIVGQFRSYNFNEGMHSKLNLNVFVQDLTTVASDVPDQNDITLKGYVCKQPNYRETSKNRKICDLLVAVNRLYGKSDYIPCIAWGRNAIYGETFPVGQKIELTGRIQSRTYVKHFDDGSSENRIAYEVSINNLQTIDIGDEFSDVDDESVDTSDDSNQIGLAEITIEKI